MIFCTVLTNRCTFTMIAVTKAILYPESSGYLVSGWAPGETLETKKNSNFLIGCSVTVSIVLPQGWGWGVRAGG